MSAASAMRRPLVWATLLYVACTFVYFLPFLGSLPARLLGPPEDNMQDLWNAWYTQVALESDPRGFFFTRLIRFPEGVSLRFHAFAYTVVIPIFVVRKLLALPNEIPVLVPLQNLLLLLSFPLSAVGAYLLARRLTRSAFAAAVAGFVFAFNPAHVAQALHHAGVAATQYLPFFGLCFLAAVEGGRHRRAAAAGAVAFWCLSALSNWYNLVYVAWFVLVFLAWQAVRDRKAPPARVLGTSAAVAAGVALALAPLAIPMLLESAGRSWRHMEGYDVLVADALGFFVFHPAHLLGGLAQPVTSRFTGNEWEATSYLGWPCLVLFAWALARRSPGPRPGAGFLLAGAIAFAVLACGSSLHVAGVRTVPLPGRLFEAVPILNHVRTPGRAVVFVYLFLALGAALGVEALVERFRADRGRLAAVLAGISALLVLDYFPARLPSTPVTCLPAYDAVARDREPGFGVLDLPLGYVASNAAMMFQLCHGKPIVSGYVSRQAEPTLGDAIERDPSAQRRQLEGARVKYVVLHKDMIPGGLEPRTDAFRARYELYRGAYREIYSDEATSVFQVF